MAPIVQNGLVPVFVDVRLGDYNADPDQLRAAVSPRTRAIMLAHTLGVPFDLDTVMELVEEHDLWLVEDNCDALGSRYRDRLTGTFGHLATSSFYPAHHITTGEGGMVVTDDDELARIARSIRDWGRDCYCAGGENNTCGKRFGQQFGSLPYGYDHKYVYSHLGYNLKATDMQAAIGCAQLARLDGFIAARKRNHARLLEALRPYEDRLILPVAPPHTDPSWFCFVITVREDAGFTRNELTALPRGQPDRDAQPVQRQPAASSGLRDDRAPRRRRPGQHGRRHEPHLLRGRLPGHRRRAHGLRDRRVRALHGRRASGQCGRARRAAGARGALRHAWPSSARSPAWSRRDRSRRARLHRRARADPWRCRASSPGSSCTSPSTRTSRAASGRSRGCSRSPARPRDRDRLTITYAVKGAFTTRMERELAPGRVWVKLPYGEFVVDPAQGRRAVRRRHRRHRVHGVPAIAHRRARAARPALLRRPHADLFVYGPLAQACAREVPSLTCSLVCEETDGRLQVDAAWPAIAPLDHPVFYLSGPPQMLDALTAQFRSRDTCPEDIRTDAWE